MNKPASSPLELNASKRHQYYLMREENLRFKAEKATDPTQKTEFIAKADEMLRLGRDIEETFEIVAQIIAYRGGSGLQRLKLNTSSEEWFFD